MIYIFCLRRPQRDKPLRTSLQRIQDQILLPSSKNYQMRRLKYTLSKSTPRFGRCTSTEHLEPFHVQDWWPGLESYSFSPRNHVIPRALSLTKPCTNNVAEYNAMLIGLQLAHQLRVRNLQAYGDSKLVVDQLRGEYEFRSDDPIPYFDSALQMAEQFEGFYIGRVPRQDNT